MLWQITNREFPMILAIKCCLYPYSRRLGIHGQSEQIYLPTRGTPKQQILFLGSLRPGAQAVDAFSCSWRNMEGYLFPPFSLIPGCLAKIRRDQYMIVMVCPVWPSKPWYPLVLELVCDTPRILRNGCKLPTSPSGGFTSARGGQPNVSSLETIRIALRSQEFSSKTIEVLLAGDRASTLSAYESAWCNWTNWCAAQHQNPM